MAQTIDWSSYEDVWVDPQRMSGAPCLKGTRVPPETITGNFDAFVEYEGMTAEEAEQAVLDNFPHISLERIHGVLRYRAEHDVAVAA